MPVHDLGYRSWSGAIRGPANRIGAIAETGCRLALKSTWVKRILLFAWMPILFWGAGLYFAEQTLQTPLSSFSRGNPAERTMEDVRRAVREEIGPAILAERLQFMPQTDVLRTALEDGDAIQTRRIVWRWLLMTFFRYPQAIAMVFLLGFVAPGLVSRDFRSRAFLLYFSRPIGRMEYVFGKLAIPAIFLSFISTLPALALYVTGLFLSPDLGVIILTWDVPFRIFLATIVLVIPTASLAIALSSLTQESRFASFAWFAVWLLGHGAWLAVLVSRAITLEKSPMELANDGGMSGWSPMSLYIALGEVQNWVFGFNKFENVWPSLLMLFLLSVGSLVVFWRRIGRSMHS